MLPPAVPAYNNAYHRILRDTPFFMMFFRDPRMPYAMLEVPPRPFYNVDSYKEEMAVIARRVYDRCQENIEMGRQEMEKYRKPSKIKPINVGDRVLLRYIPKKKTNKKLQPLYDGPFRVLQKVSDVVIRLRNIRTSKEVTVHTDRVRVLHEDCVTIKQFPKVRRAFPTNPENETLWHHYEWPPEEEEEAPGPPPATDPAIPRTEVTGPASPAAPPRSPPYSLRSSSRAPDLPNVMARPLEYLPRI